MRSIHFAELAKKLGISAPKLLAAGIPLSAGPEHEQLARDLLSQKGVETAQKAPRTGLPSAAVASIATRSSASHSAIQRSFDALFGGSR